MNLHDTKKILNSYPDELSGGMLQRVMIALTMMQKPELTLLKELQKKLKTGFLIITHDLDTAMFMADTIHVMRSGNTVWNKVMEKPVERMVISNSGEVIYMKKV